MNNYLKVALLAVFCFLVISCSEPADEKQEVENIKKEKAILVEKQVEKKIKEVKKTNKKVVEDTVEIINDMTSKYSADIVPKNMTVKEKKERFKALLLPAINDVYAELEKQYIEITDLIALNPKDKKIINLKKSYKANTDEELLMAIKPHPKSIALAQAAMESAWGTSRFFREAKNIFGVWSFDKDEARIAAGEKRGTKTIWVKKYPSIKAAIKDYYRVLARGRAFIEFRKQKMLSSDPYELVKKLDSYSEKGEEYGKELASMIKYNKFYLYDELDTRDFKTN